MKKIIILMMLILTVSLIVVGCSEKEKEIVEVEEVAEVEETVKTELSISDIEALINDKPLDFQYYMKFEGTFEDGENSNTLTNEMYYGNDLMRFDESWDGKTITKTIFYPTEYYSYVGYYGQVVSVEDYDGNMMNFQRLDSQYLEELNTGLIIDSMNIRYEILGEEEVIYIETVQGDVTTEHWFSLKYKMPLKYNRVWLDGDKVETTEWEVREIVVGRLDDLFFDVSENGIEYDWGYEASIEESNDDENKIIDEADESIADDTDTSEEPLEEESLEEPLEDEPMGDNSGMFEGGMRGLLLYEATLIDSDEEGTDGFPTQIVYYSEASFEDLVAHFDYMLSGTEEYFFYEQEGRTSIDGTVEGSLVMVIINNFMETEPEVGMNGVNVNFYE